MLDSDSHIFDATKAIVAAGYRIRGEEYAEIMNGLTWCLDPIFRYSIATVLIGDFNIAILSNTPLCV